MSGEAAAERHEVYYSGRVQGVGFRYTVRWVATRFAVTGFVKNLPDGRVQLVAEGEHAQLEAFVAELAEQMAGYITATTIDRSAASGEFGTPQRGALKLRY